METTTDGRFAKRFLKGSCTLVYQVSGVGYGRWKYDNTHDCRPREGRDWGLFEVPTIQVDKSFSGQIAILLSFRNPEGVSQGPIPGIGTGYHQNGVEYPSPYDFSIYTDYLKVKITANVKPSFPAGTPAMHPTPSWFFTRGCPALTKQQFLHLARQNSYNFELSATSINVYV